MNEQELMAKFEALAEQARKAGIFVDVFFSHVYRDGTAGTMLAACNHNGHQTPQDAEYSKAVWTNILLGCHRLMDGEHPEDEKHPDHPVAQSGQA